jgi:hypothetical protein
MQPEIYYDPYFDTDPYPVWKRMRDEAPLYCNERYNSAPSWSASLTWCHTTRASCVR